MLPYIERAAGAGAPLGAITRHMLGLFQGLPGRARLAPAPERERAQGRRGSGGGGGLALMVSEALADVAA